MIKKKHLVRRQFPLLCLFCRTVEELEQILPLTLELMVCPAETCHQHMAADPLLQFLPKLNSVLYKCKCTDQKTFCISNDFGYICFTSLRCPLHVYRPLCKKVTCVGIQKMPPPP